MGTMAPGAGLGVTRWQQRALFRRTVEIDECGAVAGDGAPGGHIGAIQRFAGKTGIT
jgi:hypothetical protein